MTEDLVEVAARAYQLGINVSHHECLRAVIAAIRPAVLEEAAEWHDQQAANLLAADARYKRDSLLISAEHHQNIAAAIRALKEST